jgi:hypothetical protein
MWQHTLVTLTVFGALVAGTATAQPAPPPAAGQAGALPTDAELRVKQAVQSAFRVLPVRDGLIFVPRTRRTGVDNIELREGTIAVNGTVVTGAELRQRLGRDADAILELSYLDPGTQRRLSLPFETAPARASEPPPSDPGIERDEPSRLPGPDVRSEESEARDRRVFRRVSSGRVRLGGSIIVAEDESVTGAVVAIAGDVEVNGRVREAVVAVGGDVRLGPKAEIDGDVTTVGGSVARDPEAVVRGHVNEVEFPSIRLQSPGPWSFHVAPWWGNASWRGVRLAGTLVRMGLFTLLAGLILVLAPRGVERIDRAVRDEPWKAALVGFFAQLLFVPLLVITILFLVISIVGIPLLALVPFGILAFFVALLMGFAGTASAVAHAARDRFGWSKPAPFALLVVGLLLIWGLTMTARLIALPGGPFAWTAGLLLLIGFLVEYAAWTVGLGGALLTRFGRAGRLYPDPVPPVPPVGPDEI